MFTACLSASPDLNDGAFDAAIDMFTKQCLDRRTKTVKHCDPRFTIGNDYETLMRLSPTSCSTFTAPARGCVLCHLPLSAVIHTCNSKRHLTLHAGTIEVSL